MKYIERLLQPSLHYHLKRGKSILLLGPRQTGKSTLLDRLKADLAISLTLPRIRRRYERDPSLLFDEVEEFAARAKKKVLVFLDEIQKVPALMDVVQEAIDQKKAQFILTGSSARKLKKAGNINLAPGRLVSLRLDPLTQKEWSAPLKSKLLYGSLPAISLASNNRDREVDLASYVEAYLEEEIRAEALVRNLGAFAHFLELASLESGKVISFRAISQEVGVSHTTIASYFEVLEDCLIAEKIEPYTKTQTRKKIYKSPKYLFFDLGVRRLCAGEPTQLSTQRFGEIFEQFIGLELIRLARFAKQKTKIKFWRDSDGPEVDWLIDKGREIIPIEVKWTDAPRLKQARHLKLFLSEYPQAKKAYVICRTPRPLMLDKKITAIGWQDCHQLFR